MFERYTQGARRAVFFARYEASRFGSSKIAPEHLLLGLLPATGRPLDALGPIPGDLLARMVQAGDAFLSRFVAGSQAEAIRKRIEDHMSRHETIPTSVDLPLDEGAKRILKNAAREADELEHQNVGCEHLLLSLLGQKKSFPAKILNEHGLEYSRVREEVARGGDPGPPFAVQDTT